MNNEDLCFRSASDLASDIRARRISPVEITEAVLDRISTLNPKLNCFCTPTPDTAMDQARRAEQEIMDGRPLGLLHGIPYSIKDLQMTRGVRTMRGSKIFEHSVPEDENPLQTRLANAGGIFLGKTTTPEFGWKGVTDSPVTGLTRNPWNLDCTPGGSSGGASAQVAAWDLWLREVTAVVRFAFRQASAESSGSNPPTVRCPTIRCRTMTIFLILGL